MYPLLCEMNIPRMETKYNFTRKDLHHLYIRFKSLVYMNALDNREAGILKIILNIVRSGSRSGF